MVRNDAGNIHIDFSGFPACQQIVKTMTHFTDKYGHAWLHIIKIEIESDSVALCIECRNVIINLVTWNEEVVKFPFNTHEEH